MKTLKKLCVLSSLLLLNGCFDFNSITYHCENDEIVKIRYNLPQTMEDDGSAVLFYNKQKIPMRPMNAASGVKYVALDEQNSYRWHTKGETGVLSFLVADHTATEEIILRDCVAQ